MSSTSFFDDESLQTPQSTERSPAIAQTQSLYRKYRPQTFESDDLVGQDHIVRTLRNAIQQQRVAHAYLFCGPRGTGKTTTARLLAKAVNCLNPDVFQRPCNECASCIAIQTGATADVIEIDAASNRGIDDIRDLRERVKYAPSQLQTKFYIIDEAHQITGAAANAFLKTLEEPPAHTKFVLATTDPEELLQTIVSRCQRFDFRRIGVAATVSRLRTVAAAEAIAISDDALQTIARHATGSLRDALGLLDQLAVYSEQEESDSSDRTITAESVLALLGVSRNDRVELLVQAMADRDATLALSTVNDAVESGEDPRQLNRQLVAYLRLLMHERAGGSPDTDERAKALAQRFDLVRLSHLARIFSETDYKIRHSPYAQLPLEIGLVEAIVGAAPAAASSEQFEQQPAQTSQTIHNAAPPESDLLSARPSTAMRDRVRGTTRGGHLQVVPPQTKAPANNASQPAPVQSAPRSIQDSPARTANGSNLTVDQIAELWPRIRNDVKAVNRRIEALLASIDPIGVNGNQITLVAAYDFHRKRMNEDEARRVVEDAISRIVGWQVTIVCVMRGDTSIASPAVLTAEPQSLAPANPAPVEASSTLDNDQPIGESSAAIDTTDLDEQRLQAAKNIFDAEEIQS
jgi:DNA polymerase-3 subunit gamma/tau